MDQKPYVFQLASHACGNDARRHIQALSSQGYPVRVCRDMPGLVTGIAALQANTQARIVTVIDGRDPGRAAAVSTLRALRPDMGIVALVERNDDASMALLLQLGVDTCSFVCASTELWVATLSRLLSRLGPTVPLAAGVQAPKQRQKNWSLIDQGWAMRTPRGHRIALTTGERAFLTTLLHSPLQKVPHDELIAAVNAAYNGSSSVAHSRRLGVMISRMRRKFADSGNPLPLKSIHNWGYMFVADT